MSCADQSSLDLFTIARSFWYRYRLRRERRMQRLALLELEDRLLSDIGVSREQAAREARKRGPRLIC
jgi:uncharacterized protein YjiS (DUF1127 family)